uniref:Uncharacterized protein n=1 Tax=Anopheles quadriannulatus TaxID=34691 RepID=A0A182XA06_ANOQN
MLLPLGERGKFIPQDCNTIYSLQSTQCLDCGVHREQPETNGNYNTKKVKAKRRTLPLHTGRTTTLR